MVPRLVLAKDTVQQVSEAIAAILDLDVEIADQRLSRVAGTGAFAQKIGEPLDRDGFVNREVMRTGDYVLIDETGKHVVCQACARAGSCYATALLCYPIKAPGTTIGTISLVACDSRRRAWLLGNLASCIAFLSKMSELITAKVLEQQALLAQESLHRQLALVMDFLGEGIIAVDRYGVITHFNSYAAQLFGVMPGLVVGQEIRDMVGGTGVYDVLCGGEQQRQQRILMKVGATTCPVLCDAIPIAVDGKSMGAVLKFRDIQTSSRMAYEMSYAAKAVTFEDILGVSRQIKQVKLEAQQVARSSSTVLIYGESGTGKELLARAIHTASPRGHGPFVSINLGAVPDGLLESELFGYEAGAFTGAKKGGKLGKFELANGGTLFLDEIGDMPVHLQVKLLRVLEERRVEPLGSTWPRPLDVRIICATHRDLGAMVARREFREDLFYRLNVVPLVIPPLRERKEDIPPLAGRFYPAHAARLGKQITGISPGAMELLMAYGWPGNVRELSNCLEYAVNMETGPTISAQVLGPKLGNSGHVAAKTAATNPRDDKQELILQVLRVHGTSTAGKKAAAAALGISLSTLYRKLKSMAPAPLPPARDPAPVSSLNTPDPPAPTRHR
ncbi:MAG: sigma 54-interacting transcriptional regulator [Bacillota bacterium]